MNLIPTRQFDILLVVLSSSSTPVFSQVSSHVLEEHYDVVTEEKERRGREGSADDVRVTQGRAGKNMHSCGWGPHSRVFLL
jgi:hypothetical protein